MRHVRDSCRGVKRAMSTEIDVLNRNESCPTAEPLLDAVWPRDAAGMRPWGDIKWAHADLRVLIDAPEGGLACHVGIYFRDVTWNGRKLHIGGIRGVSTRAPRCARGSSPLALPAPTPTLREHETPECSLLSP